MATVPWRGGPWRGGPWRGGPWRGGPWTGGPWSGGPWTGGLGRSESRAWATWRHFDLSLALATVAVGVFGCVLLYTSTRTQLEAQGLSPLFYARKQAIFLVIGVVAMVVVAAVDYRKYRDWAWVAFAGTLLALLAVYVVGHKSNGAQAWFQLGSYQMEPSELAKPALIVAGASVVALFKGRLGGRALAATLGLAAVPLGLIYKQPDLGTALVLAVVLLAILTVGGARALHMGLLGLLAVAGVVAALHFGVLQKYQTQRLTSFLSTQTNPDPHFLASPAGKAQYNGAMSKEAVSDGGVHGKGLGRGPLTNLGDVPFQHTDFIFSAIAEQLGLVGSALLLALFMIMVWRTWRAATLARDQVGTLVCAGVVAMLTFQVFENVGMAIGIMPVAGIPLPFVSYGGSAMVAAFVAVGLALSVRMHRFA
ncbi:MAG: FtsW/RodA/SpoVE family cell cycle protein [Acidimicrobiales bacterium]